MALFFLTILVFILNNADGQCVFNGPCSCSTPHYKLDLEPMMEANSDPLKVSYGDATYFLDPCGNHLKKNSQCSSLSRTIAGCQFEGGEAFGIAATSGYSASGDPEEGTVVFTYSYGTFQVRTTKLKVVCSSEDRKLTYVSEHPVMTYNLLLETKYACKNIPGGSGGLSTGSILVIIFFVFLIIYIVGGILFLKYYHKAEGVEVVPNLTFWKDLPVLIKEGFLFTGSKICKKDDTYGAL